MALRATGTLGRGISAKDLAMAAVGRIGAGGGSGYAIEYMGAAISAMSMAARMTLCNMTIEAGSRIGMVAPDETTFAFLEGRPFAPKGPLWDEAVAYWRTLPSDTRARFDRVLEHLRAHLDQAHDTAALAAIEKADDDMTAWMGAYEDPEGQEPAAAIAQARRRSPRRGAGATLDHAVRRPPRDRQLARRVAVYRGAYGHEDRQARPRVGA